jgi:Lrp/AsnC family leucine-responsive transcriptional regulator
MSRMPDDIDLDILEALQENARQPLAELGRKLGLSQPAMSERVRRLEDAGIITGYGARIDPRALGLGLTAMIRLRTTHDQIRPCLARFADMPQIVEVHRLTGEDCFLLRVIIPDPEELETVVDRIAMFGPVTTAIVLRSEPTRPLARALLKSRRGKR